jgi:Ca2+/Na+ antiporter
MVVFTLILIPIAYTQMKIKREEGALLVLGYAGYLIFLFIR